MIQIFSEKKIFLLLHDQFLYILQYMIYYIIISLTSCHQSVYTSDPPPTPQLMIYESDDERSILNINIVKFPKITPEKS